MKNVEKRIAKLTVLLLLSLILPAAVLAQGKPAKEKKSKVREAPAEILPTSPVAPPSPAFEKPQRQTSLPEGMEIPADPMMMPLPLDPNVRFGKLPNGMKYYIRKNAKPENRMEMRLAINAGSNQEDDDQRGLAHFLEHMAFNGSKHFEKNDLINYVESIGVRFGPHLNAYTSFDETVYMLQVPTDDPEILDKGLTILRDWAGGLSLDPKEIDKERGVVISEWRNSLGPMQRMQYQYFPVLFNDSRYAVRLPIGDTGIIARAPYEAVERFYKDWYRPDLMAIVLVGDIDPETMEAEIKSRFSDLENPQTTRMKELYLVPDNPQPLVSIVTDKEAPYSQVIVFHKKQADNPNTIKAYRESLIQRLISGMLNNRLSEFQQKPNPPFFSSFSSFGKQVRTVDAFYNVAITQGNLSKAALKVLLEETERVIRYGFTATELEREKAEVINSYDKALREKDKTESANYAMEYVYHYLDNQPSPGIEIENQIVGLLMQTIQLPELNSMLKSWVGEENTVIVIAAPEKDKEFLPSESEILEMRKAVMAADLAPYEDNVVAEALLPNPPPAGKVVSESIDEKHGIITWTLSNGAKVLVKATDFKNDEILFSAFSYGGNSLYGDDVFFSLSNADALVIESGVGQFDKMSLTKALAGKTVSVSPFISELEEGLTGNCSPKDLETMLQLAHLYMTAPRKDAEVFQSYVAKQKALFENLAANPQIYFQKSLLELLYGGNIRRKFPEAADFDKINFDKAFEIYRERFGNAGDFSFVFVGNVDLNTLKPLVEQYIASLPSNMNRENWQDPKIKMPEGTVNKTISKGMAPKIFVFMAMHGASKWSAEEDLLFDALTDILRIKLRESMREDKGGVYGVGVNASFSRRPKEEFLVTINFNTDPGKTDELVATAQEVVKKLISEGTDETTLNKVKETMKRERETDIRSNKFWLQVIKESEVYGRSVSQVDEFNAMVDALTTNQIKKAAAAYLGGQNSMKLVMMNEE
jgi:zinc protease